MRFTYEGIIHSGSDSDLLAGILAPQREGALRVEKMSGLLYIGAFSVLLRLHRLEKSPRRRHLTRDIAFARQAPAEHFPTHAPKSRYICLRTEYVEPISTLTPFHSASPGFIAPELRKASISHQSLVSERETCPGQISKAD